METLPEEDNSDQKSQEHTASEEASQADVERKCNYQKVRLQSRVYVSGSVVVVNNIVNSSF